MKFFSDNINKLKSTQTNTEYKTDLNLSKNSFRESLLHKTKLTGLFKGLNTMEGTVNDKNVYLKINDSQIGLFSPNITNYTGNIGDDKADITISKNFSDNIITGTIGDKEINITKGSSLDETNGENDTLTLITSLCGKRFNIKNGEFRNLTLSEQANIDAYYATQCM